MGRLSAGPPRRAPLDGASSIAWRSSRIAPHPHRCRRSSSLGIARDSWVTQQLLGYRLSAKVQPKFMRTFQISRTYAVLDIGFSDSSLPILAHSPSRTATITGGIGHFRRDIISLPLLILILFYAAPVPPRRRLLRYYRRVRWRLRHTALFIYFSVFPRFLPRLGAHACGFATC